MGLITSSFPFIAGTVCGIYIAQNYDVPNIKKVFNDAFSKAKHVEEKYRKPKRARVHLPQREMAPLKSLEREYPIVDSTFQQFCASHSIFSVEDFLIQDLYVLALTFDTGFAFFLLD
ncbi:hypothetical protein RHMOL_Rhmol09G0250600 [Rhododendron molle]|nr:hypothetical protein RHMOL_Rhmol09G0250600 [Rhododendron molle]